MIPAVNPRPGDRRPQAPVAQVVVRLLGRIEVRTADGWTSAGSPKQAAVLACLAMSAGTVIPIDVLSDRIWDGNAPRSARGVIHSHVARLRRLLEPHDGVSLARASGGGYLLQLPEGGVDLSAARSLAGRARLAAEAGDDPTAVELWRDCLAVWQLPALSGVDNEWAGEIRRRLDREYHDLVVERMSTEVRVGRGDGVIPELDALSARFPESEAITELTMRVLYRVGRADDALACYDRVRTVLRESLGADPGEPLQRLHSIILRREIDPEPAVSHRRSDDEVPGPMRPRQLPATIGDFTGRTDQVATLTRLLRMTETASAPTVVAVDGMPGVGKTALAVRVAHDLATEFPDGQVFIDLHGFSGDVPPVNPADALARMLRALGVPTRQLPDGVADRAAAFRSAVADRRILFVLDNAATEDQVLPLLPGTANCAVLITSRHKLAGIDDVGLVSLDVLSPDEAIDLFASVHRHPTATATATSQIVELCGQLPLAIRLAAARLRSRPSWTLDQLRDRLIDQEGRLTELRAGRRSVAMAFALSFEELDSDTRRAFALLGTTSLAEYSVDGVAALLGSSRAAAESIMEELVDRNLIQPSESGRYRVHDLLRLFAQDRAEDELSVDETRQALIRLRSWWIHSIHAAMMAARLPRNDWLTLPSVAPRVVPLSFTDIEPALRWLGAERVNLVTVIGSEAPEGEARTWELVDIAFDYLLTYLDPASLSALADRGLAAAAEVGDRRAQALMHLRMSSVRHMVGDPRGDDEHARRADELRDPGDVSLRRRALIRRAVAMAVEGRFATARDHITAALESAEDRPTGQLALMLNIAGAVASQTGEFALGRDHLTRAMEVLRDIGSPRTYVVLGNLGLAHMRLGDFDTARRCLDEAMAGARRMRTPRDEPAILDDLAQWHLLRGDLLAARRSAEAAIEVASKARLENSTPILSVTLSATYRDQPREAERLARRVVTRLGSGDRSYAGIRARIALAEALSNLPATSETLAEAVKLTQSAIDLGTDAGCRLLVAEASTLRARIELSVGDADRAAELAEAALVLHARIQHRPGMAEGHLLAARAWEVVGDPAAVRRHHDEAQTLREAMNLPSINDGRARPAG
ncbi:DNA-binding SARP family transcriptional activator [Stackebrandtia endophytica]|uniref:DNA-binding SARP family transcriptional activator n=1 Tax=Stackebrandtia endophytica TaxID=1496996 RepID=A0A543B1Y9_9ACTN|nr:BTAD domain-containing putative transcriptional regulator [Stackebrandtia endophytica]TQL78847.1 DNA-binding SARP family transcriptional activator [Stackebrandtia endophytica]